MATRPTRCPCDSGLTYAACCEPLHAGGAAPTAERLMRSRYSAFAVGDMDHLLRTWHPSTRPLALRDDPARRWTGLDVLGRTGGGLFDREGTVAFRARFTDHGTPGELAEDSRFVREGETWLYVAPVEDATDGAGGA